MKRLLFGACILVAIAAGCSHGSNSGLPASPKMVTPNSVSPGSVKAAPMAKTEILPASAMHSPIHPDSGFPTSSWSQITGSASRVAANTDGSIWTLSDQPSGADKYIWHYAGGTWTNIAGLGRRLAVAPDGTVYVVNVSGGIWKYSAGAWTALGGGASDITVLADGTIVVLSNGAAAGSDQAVWHLQSNGTWEQLPGSGTSVAASWDTGGPYAGSTGSIKAGGAYITNAAGAIWYENTDNTFAQLTGAATTTATWTKGGVFALGYPSGSSNPIYYYNFDSPGWNAMTGTAVSIADNGTNLYAISSSGGIYFSATTATASPSPTASPQANAIANGGFESGSLSGWYACYAAHATLSAAVDPNPALESPQPTFTQSPTTGASPAPSTDAVVVTATPVPGPSASPVATTMTPHTGTYAAQIGLTTTPRKKGLIGLCQDVTVPAVNPTLTLWVWEGGNVAGFSTADTEIDLFQGATWTATTPAGGMITTASPTATMFAETNCYNNLDTAGGSSTFGSCATPSPAQPPSSHGGQWRQKGPYSLTAYAGKSVTIMVGLWSSSTSTGYYDYQFVDDVSLTGN